MLSIEQASEILEILISHPRQFEGSIQLEVFSIDGHFKKKYTSSNLWNAINFLRELEEMQGITITIR